MENLMYYAGIAEEYYNSACPSYTQNGYEKNVLIETKTGKCIFVSGEVEPEEGELLFRCKRSNGRTAITQKSFKGKKKAETKKWSQRYEGTIRHCMYDNGMEDDFAYPPDNLIYERILSVKISNMDCFLHDAIYGCNDKGRYISPYEAICRLEEHVLNHPGGLPPAVSTVAYHRDEECNGYYVFDFSHFEKFKDGLCVVYEYACGWS